MNVYDFTSAAFIEVGDQIQIDFDYIEVRDIVDSIDSIMVKGWSHESGDSVTYILEADREVGLWTA
jgi:hypothetical protein